MTLRWSVVSPNLAIGSEDKKKKTTVDEQNLSDEEYSSQSILGHIHKKEIAESFHGKVFYHHILSTRYMNTVHIFWTQVSLGSNLWVPVMQLAPSGD